MSDHPLPDDDHTSRYCKPTVIDDSGLPMTSAFELKSGEDYLSTNWLEYFDEQDLSSAVQCVRDAFRNKDYNLRPKGRFAVLNVSAAKTAVLEATGKTLCIDHLPLNDDRSHAGIFGYTADDLLVAVELKALVRDKDVHLAVTKEDRRARG